MSASRVVVLAIAGILILLILGAALVVALGSHIECRFVTTCTPSMVVDLQGSWEVIRVNGTDVAPGVERPSIEFQRNSDFYAGDVRVTTDCGTFGGHFDMEDEDGDGLTLNLPITVDCRTGNREATLQLLTVLSQVQAWSVNPEGGISFVGEWYTPRLIELQR